MELVPPPDLTPGGASKKLATKPTDFAPTFLDIAGQPTPSGMQGRSYLPVWRGHQPAEWLHDMYSRYYHFPGDRNARAHCAIRTDLRFRLI